MKLSIIVKCYNQKELLPDCIDSVLMQDVSCDKEIILCDCSSTDGSEQVMRDYAKRFPKLIQVLVPEEEKGKKTANRAQIIKEKLLLQKAIERSTGEVFSICNASDIWSDAERCSKLLETLQSFPSAEVAYHDAFVRQAFRLTEHADAPFGNEAMMVGSAEAIRVAEALPSLSCGLYKREVYRSVPASFYQDGSRMELFNHYILKKHRGCWLPRKLAVCTDPRNHTRSPLRLVEQVLQDVQYAKRLKAVHFADSPAGVLLDMLEKRFRDYSSAMKQSSESNETKQNDCEITLSQLSEQLNVLQSQVDVVKSILHRIHVCTETSHSALTKLLRRWLFYKDKQVRENKLVTKYYILGVRLFKRTKPTVNYEATVGLVPYKYVHILHKNILTLQIVKMLNRNFPQDQHAFVFNSGASESNTGKLFGKNIYYGSADTLIINPDITERIIVHGLFSPRLVDYLYNKKHLLSRVFWCIYGGDLYAAPNDERNNYIRANFRAIITTFDREEYEKRFGKKKTYDMVFNNPLFPYLLPPSEHVPGKPYRILINNSADETTLEAFNVLSKFKDENIEIATILSYTTFGSDNIIPKIVERGRALFGEKFKPVFEWMSQAKYVEFLSGIDVYASFQNRQQGVGNMSASMLMGKKVFVRSTVSTYTGYHANGIHVADTNEIKNMSFEEFVSQDSATRESNIRVLRSRMTEENQIKLWNKVFYE